MSKERVIKATEFDSGNIPSYEWDKIKDRNEHPTFDISTKPYTFLDKVKTSTRSHGWHFQLGDNYYLAIQHQLSYGATECVSIYNTDKKQNFHGTMKPLKQYVNYVDVEYAVDMFVQEELKITLNTES